MEIFLCHKNKGHETYILGWERIRRSRDNSLDGSQNTHKDTYTDDRKENDESFKKQKLKTVNLIWHRTTSREIQIGCTPRTPKKLGPINRERGLNTSKLNKEIYWVSFPFYWKGKENIMYIRKWTTTKYLGYPKEVRKRKDWKFTY